MLTGVRVNPEMMRQSALRGYATATDLADYLTKKGIPFRDAHEIVAKTVQFAEQKNCNLSDLELSELQIFSTHIEADIFCRANPGRIDAKPQAHRRHCARTSTSSYSSSQTMVVLNKPQVIFHSA